MWTPRLALEDMPTPPTRHPLAARLLLLVSAFVLPLLLSEGLLAALGLGGTLAQRYFRTVADHYSQPKRYAWHLEHSKPRGPAHESFRIAVLGASTVGGYPYGVRYSFATVLKHVLYTAFPDHEWDVLLWNYNGWASVHLRAMVDRDLYDGLGAARPDLVIVYSGHNEFLSRIQMHAPWATSRVAEIRLRGLLHSRWYGLLRCGLRGGPDSYLRPSTPVAGDVGGGEGSLLENIDLDRDSFDGLPLAEWEADLHVERYRENLRAIVASCREAGVPVVLSAVAGGLRDAEPMRSDSSRAIDAPARAEVRRLLDEAWDRLGGQSPEAREKKIDASGAILARVDRALAIAPGFAEAEFLKGKALLLAGRPVDAGHAFRQARDHDGAPIRATSRLVAVAREIAAEERVALFDAASLLASLSSAGSPGRDVIVDSVHPTWRGAEFLGVRLAELLVRETLVPMPQGLARRTGEERAAFVRHAASALPSLPRSAEEARELTVGDHFARVADASYAMLWGNAGAARRILAGIPEDGRLEDWPYRRALVLRAILAEHEGDVLALARARERILREFPGIRRKGTDRILCEFLEIETRPDLRVPGGQRPAAPPAGAGHEDVAPGSRAAPGDGPPQASTPEDIPALASTPGHRHRGRRKWHRH